MANNTAAIRRIREILQSGATSVTLPSGTSVTYDFDQLRLELKDLIANDDNASGKRPVVTRINLSGASAR